MDEKGAGHVLLVVRHSLGHAAGQFHKVARPICSFVDTARNGAKISPTPSTDYCEPPVRYVLLDRDTKFTGRIPGDASCRQRETGAVATEKVQTATLFWNRFFRALKEEALACIIPFSEAAL